MNVQANSYLKQYLESLNNSKRNKYQSFSAGYFCSDEHSANLCAELISSGIKTASCSLKYCYEAYNESMPAVNNLQVVTNWNNKPICIIEVYFVGECRYSADFAYHEGEGDRSLESWKKTHWKFFTQECAKLNIESSQNMILILERFRVVHK